MTHVLAAERRVSNVTDRRRVPGRGGRRASDHRDAELDLIHRLRHNPRTKHLPIIVVTGHPRATTLLPAREADRFLLKPCAPGTLAIAIRDLLANGHRWSSRSMA